MPSQINPDLPVRGEATTQSVRDNFLAAKNEVEWLQDEVARLQNLIDQIEPGGGIGARVITVPRGNAYTMHANNFIGYMKIEIIGDCYLTVGPSPYGSQFNTQSVHHTMAVQQVTGSPTPGWYFTWEPNNWMRFSDNYLHVQASTGGIGSPVYIACWPLAEGAGSSS